MLDESGFNAWSIDYDQSVRDSQSADAYPFAGYQEILQTMFKEVIKEKSPIVLDIGFGTGVLTKQLYEQDCQIFGIDFSQQMIDIAKEHMPNANLYHADFTKQLPNRILEERYDFIIASYSLHHLNDQEKPSFIQQLLSLLQDKGKIMIADVATQTREEMDAIKDKYQEEWDDDEYYFVINDLEASLSECKLQFQQLSHCAGIITIEKI